MAIDLTPWPPAIGPEAVSFSETCDSVLRSFIVAPIEFYIERLADPRHVHRTLYRRVLPVERRHLAGAYRGSDHPDLVNYSVAYAFTRTEGTTELASASRVASLMEQYGRRVRSYLDDVPREVDAALAGAAEIMALLGYIHPFWDGNGHIQRITLEAVLLKSDVALKADWSVHPCPYGENMHRALASRETVRIVELLRRYI